MIHWFTTWLRVRNGKEYFCLQSPTSIQPQPKVTQPWPSGSCWAFSCAVNQWRKCRQRTGLENPARENCCAPGSRAEDCWACHLNWPFADQSHLFSPRLWKAHQSIYPSMGNVGLQLGAHETCKWMGNAVDIQYFEKCLNCWSFCLQGDFELCWAVIRKQFLVWIWTECREVHMWQ